MGKNYKEKKAFLYLHGFSDSVPSCVKNKWDRKNFEVGKRRKKKIALAEKQLRKMDSEELSNINSHV